MPDPMFHMISGGPRPVAPLSHAVEVDGWVSLDGPDILVFPSLVSVVVPAAALHFGVVLWEEVCLTATFGTDKNHYCSERRRWV